MNKSSNTNAHGARLLTLLRGLLAEPSGCPDDPWRRPILMRRGGVCGAVLDLRDVDPKAPDDALRKALRAARQAMAAEPEAVLLPGGLTYQILRESKPGSGPLVGKVWLVTGAAGAIGAGICRSLLAQGACVGAADVNRRALKDLEGELCASALDRVVGFPMNVCSPASVAAAFDDAAVAWGGVDGLVVNAGTALVAPLAELKLDEFRRLERVNVEGALLTLSEAGRRFRLQGTGGDIVLISTKNVFAPGAQFGAYSATKAAAHQLARIASLEMAPFDIRVNMVAPDAVFGESGRKSGLWAAVGPSRMKARGLDAQGLEEYYRDRNLLKARITPEHVARAVLFFATRQTPTTGATLPVDGGLPDATPR